MPISIVHRPIHQSNSCCKHMYGFLDLPGFLVTFFAAYRDFRILWRIDNYRHVFHFVSEQTGRGSCLMGVSQGLNFDVYTARVLRYF